MSNNQSTTIFMGDGANGGASPEDPNKKKRKRLLIILLVILGVVGLGVTGYYLFSSNGVGIEMPGISGSEDREEIPDPDDRGNTGGTQEGPGDTFQKDEETEEKNPSEEEPLSTETEKAENSEEEESPYDALTEDAIAFPGSTVKSEDPILLSNSKNLELEYDFGDGGRKNGVRVEHTYKDLGSKTIKAYVPGTDKLVGKKDIVVHCSKSTAEGAFEKLINIARNPSDDKDGNKWDAAVDELGRLFNSPQTLVTLQGTRNPCQRGCPFTQFKSNTRAIRAAIRKKGGQPRITQTLNTESETGKVTRIVIEI